MQKINLVGRASILSLLIACFVFCKPAEFPNYGPSEFNTPPLTAIVAAYRPEIEAILNEIEKREDTQIHETLTFKGVKYYLGTFRDDPIIVFVTGVSITNAAMTVQMALDYFPIKQVLYSGIAGAVNPELHPGDVTVPARWYYHDESNYANPDGQGGYILADYYLSQLTHHNDRDTSLEEFPRYENFGMIHPDEVSIVKDGIDRPTDTPYFAATASLLEASKRAAESMGPIIMDDGREIQYRIGGNAVTGSVFLDNAEYREWTRRVWNAEVTEMESAAVGQVCYVNEIPWVIIRAVSDLAGGQEGKNVENIYDDRSSEHATQFLFKLMEEL
jgi:adenosylhomocysteine nucleosidase